MERHHFNHAMTILSNENLNIIDRMGPDDYRLCLQNMEEAILATDLAQFMSKKAKATEVAKSGKYDKSNPEHRSLVCIIFVSWIEWFWSIIFLDSWKE